MPSSRRSWLAVPTLVGGMAALALPGPSGTTAAAGALVAVGALALLAGHAWGLFVSVPSHVTLVGRVWPGLVFTHGGATHAPAAVVLVTALPALVLSVFVLPRIASHVLAGRTRRTRALFIAGAALLLIASLVVPAFVPEVSL